MAVPVEPPSQGSGEPGRSSTSEGRPRGAGWHAGTPAKLLEGRYVMTAGGTPGRNYDVSPDGQRFLMMKEASADPTAAPPQIIVVQNWVEELKRLVPVER